MSYYNYIAYFSEENVLGRRMKRKELTVGIRDLRLLGKENNDV